MVVTTYSVGKLCQHWLQHSTLQAVKQHMLKLKENIDVTDFILGSRNPRSKRLIYAMYNEIWKVFQQEAAERIRQIDKENIEKLFK